MERFGAAEAGRRPVAPLVVGTPSVRDMPAVGPGAAVAHTGAAADGGVGGTFAAASAPGESIGATVSPVGEARGGVSTAEAAAGGSVSNVGGSS